MSRGDDSKTAPDLGTGSKLAHVDPLSSCQRDYNIRLGRPIGVDTMATDIKALCNELTDGLHAQRDDERALGMARYMKTQMPFFGVPQPARAKLLREVLKRHPIEDQRSYESAIRRLWRGKHREEKYLALSLAGRHRKFITTSAMPLYEKLVRDGQWWDFVDDIATHLVGRVLEKDRSLVRADGCVD